MTPFGTTTSSYAQIQDYTTPYGVTARETALQDSDMNSMTQIGPSRRPSDYIAHLYYLFRNSVTSRNDSKHDLSHADPPKNKDCPHDARANKARMDALLAVSDTPASATGDGSTAAASAGEMGTSSGNVNVVFDKPAGSNAAAAESDASPTCTSPLTRQRNDAATPPTESAAPSRRPSNADTPLEAHFTAAFRKAEARGELSDVSREKAIKRRGIYRSASDSKCAKASKKFSEGCIKEENRKEKEFEKLMRKANGQGWRAKLGFARKRSNEEGDGEALVGGSEGVSPTNGEEVEMDEEVTMGEVGEVAGSALRQCQTVV